MSLHNRYTKKGLCLGPLEFAQTPDDARALESKLKVLESEGITYQRKAIDSEPELIKGSRTEISLVTSSAIDRDNEVLLPQGANFKAYLKYPLLVWNHDYSLAPIGSAKWMKRVASGVKGLYEYAARPEAAQGEWFPDTIFALVTQGVLRGKSVGFLADKRRRPTQKEIDERPELAGVKSLVAEFTIFEVSACTIPCNPDCLVEAVSKGVKLLPELEQQLAEISINPWLEEEIAEVVAPAIPVINEIRKSVELPEIRTTSIGREVNFTEIVKSLAKSESERKARKLGRY